MHKRQILPVLFVFIFSACFLCSTVSVSAGSMILHTGTRGSQVSELQNDLKKLGYFSAEVTGYYGSITTAAVKRLQAGNGLIQDGITGPKTFALIDRLLGSATAAAGNTTFEAAASATSAARGTDARTDDILMPWFGGVENFFARDMTATVYDIDTGLSFKIQRSFGHNHADCEPFTAEDTSMMKKIYGGTWSWARRAIIVTVSGTKIAASMNGMPHAGIESKPGLIEVSGRSGGFGTGLNYDIVKGNNLNGHFCIHFLGSKTHESNNVDPAHQSMVQKAADWAENNL